MEARDVEILDIMEKKNGILKTEELDRYNIHPKKIQRMANDNKVERIARGLYLHPDFLEDVYYTTQYRAPKAIFSHESALYLHKLSDENPRQLIVTIPSSYNSVLLKDDRYQFYYLKEELWELGQIDIESPFGNTVKTYTKERTLAEMMGKISRGDRNLLISVLKEGLKDGIFDKLELMKYAKIFGSEEQMRNYMEILL